MRLRQSLTTEAERELLVGSALDILATTGLTIATGGPVLPALDAAGADVDVSAGRVRFPATLVREIIAGVPPKVLLAGAVAEHDVLVGGGGGLRFAPGGCAAHTLDHRSGKYRPSTLMDLEDATAIFDATSELDVVWAAVSATDVGPERREAEEWRAVLSGTVKHVTLVDTPRDVGLLERAILVFAGRPRISTMLTVTSPLRIDGEALSRHARLARLGSPVCVYSMPLAGATAPVTIAGTVTLGLAEALGAICALRALAPSASVLPAIGAGVLDMRVSAFSLAAPESVLSNAVAVEVLHDLGLPALAPALATDAKHAGVQAGYEKALKGLALAAAGADLLSGSMGLIDGAGALYLPQILIDAEIAALLRRLTADVPISPETIMAESIARVGPGGDFLKERVTRERVRAGEHFAPRIGSRLPYEQWATAGRSELDEATGRVESILTARHEGREALLEEQRDALAGILGRPATRAKSSTHEASVPMDTRERPLR